ncbi:Homeodomain-like superfamily protein [Striga hermonthica]|uniref:Homeodomain-like superfamily protein n=1 Tax=Striga hermonthica TaxID=68872 RepID=A0A9N7RFN3_STRHE|nr:Homeodomain-like superfamily protein [Striga hermonthica]
MSSSPPPPPSPPTEILAATASKPASPPKKPAPLPWSHPETLALIQAYQDKWYSVKKGPLKSSQWEEIAVAVAARCGLDEPSRTSTQCRHKIEKLRKRYRSDLRKPYPNSWPYFELMDQLERGPMPLNARPIAIHKASPPNYANNGNNYVNYDLGRSGYFDRNIHPSADSDESDEEWNKGYGLGTAKKNKSWSIDNNTAPRLSGRRVAAVNGKRKSKYYDDDDDDSEDDDEGDLNAKEWEDGGGGERELAAEIRGFAERFMQMENKKIEMMRETERCWMEMEKKKMDMILENHRKIMSCIGSAFGARKKPNMAQET